MWPIFNEVPKVGGEMMVRARNDKVITANVTVKGSTDDLGEVVRYLRSQDIEVYSATEHLVILETTVGIFERVFDCTVEEELLDQDMQGIPLQTPVLHSSNITIPAELLSTVDAVLLPEPAEPSEMGAGRTSSLVG